MRPSLILVSDDDAAFCAITAKVLENSGCRVLMAYNGAQAWELFCEHQPDVVISDLFIPQIDGFDLFKRISTAAPGAHLFGMTSCAEHDRKRYVRAAQRVGARETFSKPIKWNEFLTAIASSLGEERGRGQPIDHYNIMVVDDNEAIRDSLSSVFCTVDRGSAGFHALFEDEEVLPYTFEVSCYSYPAEAIARISACAGSRLHGSGWDLLFLDISLPGDMDGVIAGKHIRALDRNLPIIFCSAFTRRSWDSVSRDLGIAKAGNNNFFALVKPFGIKEIREIVQEILGVRCG